MIQTVIKPADLQQTSTNYRLNCMPLPISNLSFQFFVQRNSGLFFLPNIARLTTQALQWTQSEKISQIPPELVSFQSHLFGKLCVFVLHNFETKRQCHSGAVSAATSSVPISASVGTCIIACLTTSHLHRTCIALASHLLRQKIHRTSKNQNDPAIRSTKIMWKIAEVKE